MPRASAVKNWCFTINNPTPDDYIDLGNKLADNCDVYVFQLEQGAEGTPHIQGYAVFRKRVRMAGAKAVIGARAHLEPAGGDAKSNYAYCTKPEGRIQGPVARGFTAAGLLESGGQGARTDLDGAIELLRLGGSIGDVIDKLPVVFTKFHRGLGLIAQHYAPGRNLAQPPQVVWIYGPPGVGKSTYAHELWAGGYHKNNSKWWCGYEDERVVVWDEFSPGGTPYRDLLRALDRYEFKIETKGASAQLLADTFVFTSNTPPWDMYNGQEVNINALLRRITVFVHMTDFEEGHMYFDSVKAQANYF